MKNKYNIGDTGYALMHKSNGFRIVKGKIETIRLERNLSEDSVTDRYRYVFDGTYYVDEEDIFKSESDLIKSLK